MRRTAGTSYFASTLVGKTNPHAVYVTIDGDEWVTRSIGSQKGLR